MNNQGDDYFWGIILVLWVSLVHVSMVNTSSFRENTF